jgi:hypothetical protein
MKPACSVCAIYYENAPGNVKDCNGCGSLADRLLQTDKSKAKSTAVKDAIERRKSAGNPYPYVLPVREDFVEDTRGFLES